jgi:hypothetical protein
MPRDRKMSASMLSVDAFESETANPLAGTASTPGSPSARRSHGRADTLFDSELKINDDDDNISAFHEGAARVNFDGEFRLSGTSLCGLDEDNSFRMAVFDLVNGRCVPRLGTDGAVSVAVCLNCGVRI